MSLNQGEILGLLGPNGVGKSTIFNIIIGLLKPNYGSVFIEKKNVTQDPIFYRTKKTSSAPLKENRRNIGRLARITNANLVINYFSKKYDKILDELGVIVVLIIRNGIRKLWIGAN